MAVSVFFIGCVAQEDLADLDERADALTGGGLRDFGLIAPKHLQYARQSVTREPSGRLDVTVETYDSSAEDGDPRIVFITGKPARGFHQTTIAQTSGLLHHAIDAGGRPHVAIAELTRYDEDDEPLNEPGLLYATRSGSGWEVETVTSDRVRAAKIFLDSCDAPQILFERDGALVFATRDEHGWNEEPTGLPGAGTFIAMDAAQGDTGTLHVAYVLRDAAGVDHLFHGLRAQGSWTGAELVPGGLAQRSLGVVSLAVRGGGSNDAAVLLDALGRNPVFIRRGNGTVVSLPPLGSEALGTLRAQVFFESNGALQAVMGFGLNGMHHARYPRHGTSWTVTQLMGSEPGADGFAPLPVGALSGHTVHIVAASVNFDTLGGSLRYLRYTP